jgi:hypothetical protein
MSSHREAPEISQDPVADNTDVYAFRSPDNPNTVTIVANYLPGQAPAGGPNFYEFGNDVLYSIYIDNDGDGEEDIVYSFEFTTQVGNPNVPLQHRPVQLDLRPELERKQFYKVTRTDGRKDSARHQPAVPPCNVGRARRRTTRTSRTRRPDAAERREGLRRPAERPVLCRPGLDLRPAAALRPFPEPAPDLDGGVEQRRHARHAERALDRDQVPILEADEGRLGADEPDELEAVLGVYAAASRARCGSCTTTDAQQSTNGPWIQVSRLGNPLFNEVVVPMSRKDEWNATDPSDDKDFLSLTQHPELSGLIPVLYPGIFPNLAALNASGASRADLVAILLTGIPAGIIPGFQNLSANLKNRYADLLRLNVAIPPTASPNNLGILGGTPATRTPSAGRRRGRHRPEGLRSAVSAGRADPARRRSGLLTEQPFNPPAPTRPPPDVPYVGTLHDLQHPVAVVPTSARSGGHLRGAPPRGTCTRIRTTDHPHATPTGATTRTGAPPARGRRSCSDRQRARRWSSTPTVAAR